LEITNTRRAQVTADKLILIGECIQTVSTPAGTRPFDAKWQPAGLVLPLTGMRRQILREREKQMAGETCPSQSCVTVNVFKASDEMIYGAARSSRQGAGERRSCCWL
jgi:hypothetical protein